MRFPDSLDNESNSENPRYQILLMRHVESGKEALATQFDRP
jgi:hypothetical protein